MTFQTLIADDEYFIRQRLKKIICWQEWGLEFAGEAENGQEVCEFLEKHKVDILLLDIKMPKMNGLEVCRKISETSPETKIIILSGYNEFEYAQKALEYGVVDYILKPVQQENLHKSLFKCIEKIKSTHVQNLQLEQYYHYKKCESLSALMSDEITIKELCSIFPEFLDIQYSMYIAVYIFQRPTDTIYKIIKEFRASDYKCEYIQEAEHIYVIQFFFHERETLASFHSLLLKMLEERNTFLFFSVGEVFAFSDPWKKYYEYVLYFLNSRFFYDHSASCMATVKGKYNTWYPELADIRSKLTTFIHQRNRPKLETYLTSLFQTLTDRKSIDFTLAVLTEIFTCYQIYWDYQKNAPRPGFQFIKSMLDEEYQLSQVQQITVKYGRSCIIHDSTLPAETALSRSIVRYIDENYRNPELSVAMIAEHFQHNASYIGTMFKSIYNKTLLQYITKVRMEKSAEYLKDGTYNISEIAELVGYSDVFYFSKNFKRYFDCSPKNYRTDVGKKRDPI